ncbi:hypothetical protein J41TS12_26690 [Paenibacillus antibioticophila]|uniref:Uncharacterized protein n=2 Tax=Paenibacillus TaxID=44249 RepID=A0A919Y417_9BACL|nr:hypothetical protein J41TS12_26690 [Paenibacillus antibioticophila]GIO44252.1 hypothetical protein J41TS4_40100 [Paenibacillus apis]
MHAVAWLCAASGKLIAAQLATQPCANCIVFEVKLQKRSSQGISVKCAVEAERSPL